MRTVVVVIMAALMVVVAGSYGDIWNITVKVLVFLILSGIATSAS